jgi:hypothetical protein
MGKDTFKSRRAVKKVKEKKIKQKGEKMKKMPLLKLRQSKSLQRSKDILKHFGDP